MRDAGAGDASAAAEDLEPIEERSVPPPRRRGDWWRLVLGVVAVTLVAAQVVVVALLVDLRLPRENARPESAATAKEQTADPVIGAALTPGAFSCPAAEHQWKTAGVDSLPAKADALTGPVEADLPEIGTRLRDEYGATDVRIEQRPWRVWSRDETGAVVVEFATIPVIVATLLDAWRCPPGPVEAGVPVEFVLRNEVLVPYVVGLPLHTASAALHGSGLRPSVVDGHPDAAASEVLTQEPPAGMVISRGSIVSLGTSQ